MARIAGSTSSHLTGSARGAAGESRAPHSADSSGGGSLQVLLIGTDGIALRATVDRVLSNAGFGLTTDAAESFLEAVLISGAGRPDAEDDSENPSAKVEYPLILAGLSQELEQLEPAVRSLRKVNPQSKIVLLADVADETLARRAKVWGADDYLIVPAVERELHRLVLRAMEDWKRAKTEAGRVDAAPSRLPSETPEIKPIRSNHTQNHAPAAAVREVVKMDARPIDPPVVERTPAQPIERAAEKKADRPVRESASSILASAAAVPHIVIPQIPLIVQTVLLNDLLNGRADLIDRLVSTLQGYIGWGGKLRFIPVTPEHPVAESKTPGAKLARVDSSGMHFGGLVLEPSTDPDTHENPGAAQLLEQAASWMGALLAISRRYEQLRSLAITDELSGAYNRRYFTKFVTGLLERARVSRFRVSLLLFDIDDFKIYNDKFGHAAGDSIIKELTRLMRTCTRPHDLVARIGGDEFAVVFWDNEAPRQPNSEHPRDAVAATQRFRKTVQEHQWSKACNIQGSVSISGGLATFPWDADTLEALMERADEALLRAKAAGKNVVMLHGSDVASE